MFDDLDLWQSFCQWLEDQPWNRAIQKDVPEKFVILLSPDCRRRGRLREVNLVFYWKGLGWRLRPAWKDRVEELRTTGSLREAEPCETAGK